MYGPIMSFVVACSLASRFGVGVAMLKVSARQQTRLVRQQMSIFSREQGIGLEEERVS